MNPYTDAAQALQALLPRHRALVVAGLPRVGGLSGIGVQNKHIGATQSTLSAPPPNAAPVMGQPSLRIVRVASGSAIVVLERNVNNADLLSDAELVTPLQSWAESDARDARQLMRGTLRQSTLNHLNNPYGHGARNPRGRRRGGLGRLPRARGGISNMAIVNSQSGELSRSLSVVVQRSKTGVRIEWHYDTDYAAFLAFGTLKMKAHGPFSTAVIKRVQGANTLARDMGRTSYFRNRAIVGAR